MSFYGAREAGKDRSGNKGARSSSEDLQQMAHWGSHCGTVKVQKNYVLRSAVSAVNVFSRFNFRVSWATPGAARAAS